MNQDEEWLRWRFIGDVLNAIAANRRTLEWKTRLLIGSLLALFVSIGLLGGYFIYVLARGSVT